MHEIVFYLAFAWMTVLIVVSAAAVIRLRSTAGRVLALDTLTPGSSFLEARFSTFTRRGVQSSRVRARSSFPPAPQVLWSAAKLE